MIVATAKGRHFYFQARDGHQLGNRKGAFTGYNIDIRAGNAYVVGPGSIYETGVIYTMVTDASPAPIPDWAIDAIETGWEPATTSGGATEVPDAQGFVTVNPFGDEPRGLAAVPAVVRGPRVDRNGERHDVLVRYACSLRARAVPYDEAVTLYGAVWGRCDQPPACSTGLSWSDAEAKLRDVYRRYPEGPSAEYNQDHDDGGGADQADTAPQAYAFTLGGSFILDTPADPAPLWGDGGEVLLADGEALIIAGGQGLGKTTLLQQLALGRAGFREFSGLLGYPIKPGSGKVLYLAMDRPRQAARSLRRMVGESMRHELNERLVVWQGPPPHDLAKLSALLLSMCERAGADSVFVDSLKDAAIGLTDDEVGAGYNRARQKAITAGVQVVESHHNRKTINGAKAERPTIDDLYGSTWLPSGAGSVLLLSGAPGDPIVVLHHIKQPASEVGPLKIIHDHVAGRSVVWHAVDLVLLAQGRGLSAVEAAIALFDTTKPTSAEKEKARRRLDALTAKGVLMIFDAGDKTTNRPTRWAPV